MSVCSGPSLAEEIVGHLSRHHDFAHRIFNADGIAWEPDWEESGGVMALLQWSSKYLTGIAAVDADHQGLFRAINALHDNVTGGADTDQVQATLDMLADYVDSHFAREEALMERAGYPDIVEHMATHRRIQHQVQDYRTAYKENSGTLDMTEFLDFLGNWLKGYIAMSDVAYIPFVKNLSD
jgi:hemerythrin-like metal-binding protein